MAFVAHQPQVYLLLQGLLNMLFNFDLPIAIKFYDYYLLSGKQAF